VVNEIMYYPYAGYDEFIEIRNLTASAVSLDGPSGTTWRVGGIGFNVPTGSNRPGKWVRLGGGHRSSDLPNEVCDPGPGTNLRPIRRELCRTTENGFRSKSRTNLTSIRWARPWCPTSSSIQSATNDRAPWPIDAHGNGPSLQRLNSSAYADDPINWFASGATPGAANTTNTNPTVALTAPAQGATFTVPATVNFRRECFGPRRFDQQSGILCRWRQSR
jgi:hypothetical protein